MFRKVSICFVILVTCVAVGCTGMKTKKRQTNAEFMADVKKYNASVKDPADKIKCKKIKVTGSIIPKRVCRTVREWRGDRSNADDMMRRNRNQPPPDLDSQ